MLMNSRLKRNAATLGCAALLLALGACSRLSAPAVVSTSPANGATSAAVGTDITATFNQVMEASSLNNSTFTVAQGSAVIAGSVSYTGLTATFNPTQNLAPGTVYRAVITTGAQAANKADENDDDIEDEADEAFEPEDEGHHHHPFAWLLGGLFLSGRLSGSPDSTLKEDFEWTFTTASATDTTAPTVTTITPAAGASNVALGVNITAAFSEAMDPSTINSTTIGLTLGSASVAGSVSYSGTTAAFNPSAPLLPSSQYTARVTTGAEDLAGNAIVSERVWSFSTVAAADTAAPTVSFTSPFNGAIGVPVGNRLSATFSETMSPATINALTFTVRQGATPVVGVVTYTGVTATFDPAVSLLPNTLYTATITTGAQDSAGNGLESNFVWNFTTGGSVDGDAPTVTFATPEDGSTEVPVSRNFAVSFSEVMDADTINASTFTLSRGLDPVAGVVTSSGIFGIFNPSENLIPDTVYTGTITTGAKDLAGNALAAPFVWSFTTTATGDVTLPLVSATSPANGETGVLLGRNIAATFSEQMDPLTITPVTFTLRRGSVPVAGTVSYSGVTAVFNPLVSLLPSTMYTATVTTGAQDLAGNAMAENRVWTFTTGVAPDAAAPAVIATDPVDDATGVALNKSIGATFSEAMNPLTINTASFTLTRGVVRVPGTVSYSGVIAIFDPLAALAANTEYTATITTGATDLAGNALAANRVWTFTTGAAPDTGAPTIISTDPATGAVAVATNKSIGATFSEAMNPLTINAASFTLNRGGVPVAGTVSYSGVTAIFDPLTSLAANTVYTATVTTAARDLAGNALAANRVWTFTTGAAPDTGLPTVTATDPANNATGVALNKSVGATFSEAMNPLTINAASFTLSRGAVPVAGAVSYSGVTAIFDPITGLLANTEYTATIAATATDAAGNNLAADRVWSFTTGTAPDASAPTILSTDPVNNATAVPLNKSIGATFSEAMNPLTLNPASFTVFRGLVPVAGTVSYSGVIAIFNPLTTLAPSTVYTATITTDAQDLAGNALAADRVWTFTTGTVPDTGAPTVLSTDPLNNAIGVPLNKSIGATFSEAMNPLTINTASFTVTQGLVPVLGTVSYSGVTAIFNPLSLLTANLTYTATISNSATDAAGNALAADRVWTFSTGTTQAQNNVPLGAASAFAILAGSTVTSTGLSIINGDLGVSPGEAVAGFPPAVLNGEMFTGVGSAAGQAKEDLTIAFNEAAARSDGSISLPGDLSGLTLFPGLYTNSTSVMLSAGACTLDAQGDVNAVFLFKMGSTLTAGSNTQVILAGGAKAANVYWQVGTSATLGTNSVFKGNVLAQASITMATGASLEGRALTQTAAVSLDASIITAPMS